MYIYRYIYNMYKNKKTEEEEEDICVYINTDPSIDLKASRPPKNVYKRCQHVYQVSIQENQGDKKNILSIPTVTGYWHSLITCMS